MNAEIQTWSPARRPDTIRVADGFAGVVRSERVEGTLRRVIEAGGRVFAALDGGVLVGYASLVRPRPFVWDGRLVSRSWDERDDVIELGAIEVARPFRGAGIARRLAAAIGDDHSFDDQTLFGIAVVHHWDLGWSSLPPFVHLAALASTLGRAGMRIEPTDDPEVAMHPANALFVRSSRARGTT